MGRHAYTVVNMNTLLAVAIGGGLGAVARFMFGMVANPVFGTAFPYSTLLINIIGSTIIGYVAAKLPIDANNMRAFIITGVLGGFTTFSAFSLETLKLYSSGQKLEAAAYIIASILLCLAGVVLGDYLGK